MLLLHLCGKNSSKKHCASSMQSQHWPDQRITAKWLPNVDFEGPYLDFAVDGRKKPMEPFGIVTLNNKYVALPPNQTNGCMVVVLTVLILPDPLQAGRNVCHRHSPCLWLLDLIVVQLVVQPHNKACESLTPTQGATQQSVDGESLTPTKGAKQQRLDCESLTPTQEAMQQSVD